MFKQVSEFNEKIVGLKSPEKPTQLSTERKEWAINAFIEEVVELDDAETFEDEIDAITDLLYFVLGRFYEMGIDPNIGIAIVHKANMKKAAGRQVKRGGAADAVKPKGWVGPDWSSILR